MYADAVETSTNAVGTLQKQQDIYMESTDAKLQKLKTTWQDLYSGLIDEDELNAGVDALSNLVQVFDNFIDSFGGGIKSITAFGTVVANIFNKQISKAIILANSNAQKYAQNVATAKKQLELISAKIADVKKAQATTGKGTVTANDIAIQKEYEVELNYAKQLQAARKGIAQEQYSELVKMQQKRGQLEYETTMLKEQATAELEKATNFKNTNLQESEFIEQISTQTGDLISKAEAEVQVKRKALKLSNEKLQNTGQEIKNTKLLTKEFQTQINILKDSQNTKKKAQAQDFLTASQTFRTKMDKEDTLQISSGQKAALTKLNNQLNTELNQKTLDWEKIYQIQDKIAQKTAEIVKLYQDEIDKSKQEISTRQQSKKQAEEELETAQEELNIEEKKGQAVDEYIKKQDQVAEKEQKIANLDAQFSSNMELANKSQKINAQVQLLTASLSTLTTAWSSLSSIKQTLKDDTASFGDKVQQITMTLSMSIPMLISGIKSVKTSLIDLAVSEKLVEAGSTSAITALKALLKQIVALAAANIGTVLGLAAIAAIIGTVVIATNKAVKASKAHEEALTALTEQIETLTTRYEELEEAASEFKNSISDYSDAIDALNELEKGTEEYTEALDEANEKAKELIETYDLYNNYTLQDGLYTIDEDTLSQKYEEESQKAQQVKNLAAFAQLNLNRLNLEDTYQELINGIKVKTPVIAFNTSGAERKEFEKQYSNADSARLQSEEAYEEAAKILGKTITEVNAMDEDELLKQLRDAGYTPESTVALKYEDSIAERLLTTDEVNTIVDVIKQATEDNNGIKLSDEALTNVISNSELLSNELKQASESIVGLRDEFEALIDSTSNLEEEQLYYANEIVQSILEQQYGSDYTTLATNEDGNIDAALYNQIVQAATGFNKKYSEELSNALLEENLDLSESYETTWGLSKNYGYDILNTEDLAKQYAELIMGYDADYLSYSSDNDTNTITDNSTGATFSASTDDMLKALAIYSRQQEVLEEYTDLIEQNTDDFNNIITSIEQNNSLDNLTGGDFIGAILNAIANNADSVDFTSVVSNLSKSKYSAIQQLSGEEVISALGLTEDQIEDLGFGSAEQFIEAWEEGLRSWDYETWLEQVITAAKTANVDAKTLITDIQSGDVTSDNILENEEYQDLLTQLDKIKEEYPELTSQVELLNNSWLVGTQAYTEALESVQDSLYEIELNSLINDAEELTDTLDEYFSTANDATISIGLDDEDFQQAMDDLLNTEYSIDVAIHTEAEQEFDSITAALEDIQTNASYIGEDFIVAAENVRELGNTFPGILNGLTYLSDGTIQLNEEAVQSAMEMANAEAQADAQATIEKLENQATLLKAKQLSYQNIANAALVLAQSETESDNAAADAKAVISSELANLETLNSQTTANSEIDNNVEVADSSNTNAQIVANNWQAAFSSMSTSSAQAAKDAIQNMQAVTDRDLSEIVDSSVTEVDWNGSTGLDSEASITNSIQDALNKSANDNTEYWASIAEKYQQLADAAGVDYTDIMGMINEATARTISANNTFANIASGNGSDGSTSDPEVLDYLEDEADRYHDINLEIEKLSTNLKRLQNQQDKLYGQDLIDNLNEQLDILQQQNAAYETKIALAKQEASEIKANLASSGVTFTDDGYIANYASVMQTKLNYVNGLIEKYNAMSASEQEEFADTVDAAKEDYEDFVEQIENYDTLISETIPDLEDDIQEAVDKEIEINISKFTMEIEIRLDMSEAEREYNEFKQKIIDGIADDDYVGLANYKLKDMNSYYNSEGTAAIQKLTEQVNNTLAELAQMDKTGWSDVYGDDRSQALEDLQTYYEKLIESQEDFNDLIDDIQDYYVDTIKKANDAFDDQVDTYEYIGDLLEHDMKVVKLIYGDEAYSKMSTYYDKIETNNNNQLSFLSQEKAYIEKMMAAETNEEALAEWKDQWESVVSDLNSLVEDSIQNIIDKYTNAINETFDTIADNLTNGMGLDFTETQWDLINENADSYLDTVNAIYKTQEVKSKFIDAINNTDSVSAQKKLKAVMKEQLDILESQEELTQYDIDRANAMYEIAVKQIALEEAQQNKSSMRLRRDSQGNYTYQYVADEDSISKAQEELAEAQNNLFNLDKDQVQETLDDALSAYKEWQDAITSYTEKAYEDGTYNSQAYWDGLDEINAQYTEKFNRYWENYQEAKANLEDSTVQSLKSSYDTDNENFITMISKNETLFKSFTGTSTEDYQKMTDEEKKQAASLALENEEVWNNISDDAKTAITEEIVPQVTSGVATMIESIAGEGGFEQIATDATNNVKDVTEDYEDSLNKVAASADVDFTAIGNGIDSTVDSTEALLEDNQELLDSYDDEITKIKEVIANMYSLISMYNSAAAAAKRATTAAYDYITATNEKAATAAGNSSSGSSSSSGSKITSTLKNVVSAAKEALTTSTTPTDSEDPTPDNTETATKNKMYVIVSSDGLTYSYYPEDNKYKLYNKRTNRSKKDALSEYNRFKTSNKDKYDFTLVNEKSTLPFNATSLKEGQNTIWSGKIGKTVMYRSNSEDSLRLWAVQNGYYPAFDTGGYTGSWGDDGKLAVLHQKELVLNASDTENMLAAVGIVRDMSSLLDNINSNITDKLLALAAGLSSPTGSVSASSDTLEQNVHIEASFPNVSSSKEIENAFNNLTNIASQRAFNNKR